MRKLLIFLIITLGVHFLQAQNIYTVAGNGVRGFSGDGGYATAAELWGPEGTYIDALGNMFIADQGNNRIRKVLSSGIINTVAGNGIQGYSGDGGQATAAELYGPQAIFVDTSGNIFIPDYVNYRVRKVLSSGIINTVAGNGVMGYSGDGGPATSAELNYPSGISVDAYGNIFIADYNNNRIRKVNTTGTISTVAGNGIQGFSGDGGQATAAELYNPEGIFINASGCIFIVDLNNNRIREVNTSGIISTVAGNGAMGFSGDGGQATAAELHTPEGVSIDTSGNIFIADQFNNRIREVNTSGIINTVAGNGALGFSGDGGPATSAELYLPEGVFIDASGNMFITDFMNSRIREVTSGSPLYADELTGTFKDISVYPNPNNGSFNLSISNYQVGMKSKIEIYNMLGEKVYTSQFSTLHSQFSIEQPSGIYLYRVIDEKGNLLSDGKFVIAN